MRIIKFINKGTKQNLGTSFPLRIVQSHTANEIKDLSSRIDTLEDKIDLILKKIS